MQFIYRPLPIWPHPTTPWERRRGQATFRAGWVDTLQLLEYELGWIDGTNVVFGVGLRPEDIRLDGAPRANARPLNHPGVELSFDSRMGRLTYATDVCDDWQHNVRSIALGLAALRAVDRYGISSRGQQYSGFAQIAAGGPDADQGRRLVEQAGSIKAALMAHHPDHGGDQSDFAHVQAYREQVEA